MEVYGFGYFDAETLVREAKKYNKFTEESENKFNVLKKEDKQYFELYILQTMRKLAEIGCTSFEYQTDTDLKRVYSHFFTVLEQLGFQYNFYKLDKKYCDKKYNLIVTW